MLPFKTLITVNKNASQAVYQQVANAIVDLIRHGTIRPGSYIPPSRTLADILQLHRKTIVAAYEELQSQDWIVSVPRKGMMVSVDLPELKPRNFKAAEKKFQYGGKSTNFFYRVSQAPVPDAKKNIYRFVITDGFPDARLAPMDALFRQYRYFLQRPFSDKQLMVGDLAGAANLRQALCGFLSDTRGLNIGHHNVLVTRGAQMAIYLAARLLLRPGAKVIVGEPGYEMANQIFEQFGAVLIKVHVDNDGIDVDEIEEICRRKKPDMLYVVPHHHHPTTATLSAARRMKLLSIIRTYKLPVIEDDYDYDFHFARSPILPLASADHGGYIIYIGSITKSFASTIRLGYMIATDDFVWQAAQVKKLIDIRGDVLMEEAFAILFNNGDMQKHLKKSVSLYRQRRDSFCSILDTEFAGRIHFAKPSGGMSVWTQFEKKYDLKKIALTAATHGLFLNANTGYNTGRTNYNAMRMGFASFNEKEMRSVMDILKKLM
jgi:GntR family transcriptional regulator/MocR family aminotransferase